MPRSARGPGRFSNLCQAPDHGPPPMCWDAPYTQHTHTPELILELESQEQKGSPKPRLPSISTRITSLRMVKVVPRTRMEKRKVQMGSINLYSGYRKRARQSWGSPPNTLASLLCSHPALSQGEGLSLQGGHEPHPDPASQFSTFYSVSKRTGRTDHSLG